MDLESVVEELYGLDPSDFTAARDTRVREARKGGNRDLAAGIRSLKKPSTAAWAVNLLARGHEGDLRKLLGLGEQLRAAQASLSGEEIRSLGRQRHRVVAGMARQARRLAEGRGVNLSDSLEREISDTLEAALADPAAGEAVRSGRLVRPLTHTGLDRVDLGGAVAGIPPGPGPTEGRAPDRDGERDRMEAELAAARTEADRTADAARAARDHLTRAVAAHDQAQAGSRAASETVERLERQLDDARRVAAEAEGSTRAAAAAAEEARAHLGPAEEAARQTAERLDGLRRRAGA